MWIWLLPLQCRTAIPVIFVTLITFILPQLVQAFPKNVANLIVLLAQLIRTSPDAPTVFIDTIYLRTIYAYLVLAIVYPVKILIFVTNEIKATFQDGRNIKIITPSGALNSIFIFSKTKIWNKLNNYLSASRSWRFVRLFLIST